MRKLVTYTDEHGVKKTDFMEIIKNPGVWRRRLNRLVSLIRMWLGL